MAEFPGAPLKPWAPNNGYKEGLTIDRIDGNREGLPGNNCHWIPAVENCKKQTRRKSLIQRGAEGVMPINTRLPNPATRKKAKDLPGLFNVSPKLHP